MEKRKLKIGIICFDLQNFTADFINRLQEEVKEFAIITAYPILDKIGDLELKFSYKEGENVSKHKVKTYSDNTRHTPEGILLTPNSKNAIKCALKSDLILHYGIHSSTALISGLLGFILRKKQISVNQTLPLTWEKKRKWWILLSKKIFFKFCNYHVAQSKVSIQCLNEIYKIKNDKIRYIPFESGINSFKRKYDLNSKHIKFIQKEETINFLFAANLLRFKGVFLIIDALALLLKNNFDVKLIIAGPESISIKEPRIDDLISYTKQLGIDDKVIIVGNMSLDDLVFLYEKTDVFVLPTMRDTFGKVLVEAGIAGKPLITSDACGAMDTIVINGLNGYIFKAGSAEDLSLCMGRIANRELINKMGIETQKIIDQYLIDTQNEALEFSKIIKKLMQ